MVMVIISVKTVVSAHEEMLDVEYDLCEYSNYDGLDEKWYCLDSLTSNKHISHEVIDIKYYFEEHTENDSSYTWTTDVSEEVAQEIKNAYAASMEKWNNVYFYSYDSNGNISKHKIINVIEGTKNDHNLSIYPVENGSIIDGDVVDYIAATYTAETNETLIETVNGIRHKHNLDWCMNLNVYYFYNHDNVWLDDVLITRERNGAHELGHILGLRDVELYCGSNFEFNHHEEVLMGYGTYSERTLDITYKDIAGVAITRGFHTDDDHMWLRDTINSTLHSNKYICSICNAVKYSSSFIMGALSYGSCNNNHALSSGNMMAVASYGTKDYYKCKYCRYVAPFEDIVEQNYSYVMNDNTHTITNNVNGLQYTISGEHDGLDCSVCGYHKHMYNARHVANNSINHNSYCRCGEYIVKVHAVKNQTGLLKAQCVDCGYLLNLGGDIGQIQSILKVSANGSKMLSTGIIILVDEDVETYLNGTLAFYNFGDNVSSS